MELHRRCVEDAAGTAFRKALTERPTSFASPELVSEVLVSSCITSNAGANCGKGNGWPLEIGKKYRDSRRGYEIPSMIS